MISQTTRVSDIRSFIKEHPEKISTSCRTGKEISNEDVDQYNSGNPYFSFETIIELNDHLLVNKVLEEKYEGYIEELYQIILV